MKQSDTFMEAEGDAWLVRNPFHGDHDPVLEAIVHIGMKPTSVLEVGCSDGWRLSALRGKFDCEVMGIEPSKQAGRAAAGRRVPVLQGTAEELPVESGEFDTLIYGFCLYLTDPEDWLKIAAEGDRILSPGGHLVIHDFYASSPFARRYSHRADVMSYHIDFANLWLGNPLYRVVHRRGYPIGEDMVTVLVKGTRYSIVVLP